MRLAVVAHPDCGIGVASRAMEQIGLTCAPDEEFRLCRLALLGVCVRASCIVATVFSAPSPPLAKQSHDAGRHLFERGSAHHGLPGCQVLCGISNNALEVSVCFPLLLLARPTLRIPRGGENP
jgi:hypothetical protein